MTAPAQANVSTISAGEGEDAPNLAPKPEPFQTLEYRRTFQHYVNNNNASGAESIVQGTAGTKPAVQAGWYWLPYTQTAAAMTLADQDTLSFIAKEYAVLEQGFTIKRINCIQQTINSNASTTAITNTFVSAPVVMMYKDTDHEMFEQTYSATIGPPSAATLPIWKAGGFDPNTSWTKPFDTHAAGELPLTKQTFSSASISTGYTPYQLQLMWGGDIEMLGSGEQYHYTWKPPHLKWILPNLRSIVPGTGTTPSLTSDIATEFASLFIEMGVGFPSHVIDPPVMHLLRVPPLHDTLGSILIEFELWVEYYLKLAYKPGRFLSGKNAANPGASLVTNVLPYPGNYRKNYAASTNMPLLADAPGKAKGKSTYGARPSPIAGPSVVE